MIASAYGSIRVVIIAGFRVREFVRGHAAVEVVVVVVDEGSYWHL